MRGIIYRMPCYGDTVEMGLNATSKHTCATVVWAGSIRHLKKIFLTEDHLNPSPTKYPIQLLSLDYIAAYEHGMRCDDKPSQ